jgi:hypothetical protein
MSNHKTIKINPELFSLTKQKKTKPDASQAKTKKNNAFKPNNLKNKLLERIKAHKNKEQRLILKDNPMNSTIQWPTCLVLRNNQRRRQIRMHMFKIRKMP